MLDWTAIDTVLLDMDGTLLDLKFDSDFYNVYLPKRMHETLNMSQADAKAAIANLHATTRGQLLWYCTEHWSKTLDIDLVSLKHEILGQISIKADTPAFLNWLATQDLDVRLVTNAHPTVLALKSDQTRLTDYIDATKMTCSHEFGFAKEHASFWRAYAHRQPFDPQRCLLIDDNVHVLRAAADFGLRHLIVPAKPDSSAPAIDGEGFPTIMSFHELMGTQNFRTTL